MLAINSIVGQVIVGFCYCLILYSFIVRVHVFVYYKYDILMGRRFQHTMAKIQKTEPGQGYHAWHYEATPSAPYRKLATMIYLNDNFEGGETEFLYQSKRVEPKMGRLVICPTSFTHTHRGNPPLTGDKYMLNGWVSFFE